MLLLLYFPVFLLFSRVFSQSAENFFIEDAYWCANVTNPPIKVYVSLSNSTNGKQILDGNLSSSVDIGENVLSTIFLEHEAIAPDRHWYKLFTIKEDYCKSVKMYFGEFGYNMQRAAAIRPQSCPIRKGNYHLTNYELNFQQLRLQTFPFERLRVTMQLQDKKTKELLSCMIIIITNFPESK